MASNDPTTRPARDDDATYHAGQEPRPDHPDRNPDALTGAPGSHPLGTGAGAAGGGLAGAAIGFLGGPVGAMVGAAIGAVVGGLGGKAAAEYVDPTEEDAYWREHYRTRPYITSEDVYDDYQAAYVYGWETCRRCPDRSFEEAEPELRRGWESSGAAERMDWERARPATRDAWERVRSRHEQRSANRPVQ